jgi:hypothetical protein
MKKGDYVKIGDTDTIVFTIQVKHEIGTNSPYRIWSTRIIYTHTLEIFGRFYQIGDYLELEETPDVKVVKPIFLEE